MHDERRAWLWIIDYVLYQINWDFLYFDIIEFDILYHDIIIIVFDIMVLWWHYCIVKAL